jgi:hypothetical protein
MAYAKITPVKEHIVGKLSPALRKRRARLDLRRERINGIITKLEEDYDDFQRTVEESVAGSIAAPHAEGYRLDDDGTVYQTLCPCPACQALLYGMPMQTVINAFLKQGVLTTAEAKAFWRVHLAEERARIRN